MSATVKATAERLPHPDWSEHIARIVAAAPQLTPEIRSRVAVILHAGGVEQ